MTLWVLGINHETASLDWRGRFALARDQLLPALHELQSTIFVANEVTLLSTCNRTEVYCTGTSQIVTALVEWMAQMGHISVQEFQEHAYIKQDEQAVQHVLRVASGLDSMVLGEPQILGQLKEAVRWAQEVGTLGAVLHHFFQHAFSVAKEVRSSTPIGAYSISMAAAVVRLSAQLFENLQAINVLLVGAGEMIELSMAHIAGHHPKSITIANRTISRSEQLAHRFDAQVMKLVDLPDRLHEFDMVISCTASALPIIGLGAVKRALKIRKHRPIFMADLAVPRDIEPEVKQLSDVYLYTVDDLSQVVKTGQEKRQEAVAQAEVIIEKGVHSFSQWMSRRELTPMIQALQKTTHAWRDIELNKARRRLEKGEPIDQVLDQLANGVLQKTLHPLWVQLHRQEPGQQEILALIERMYLKGDHEQ